VSKLIAVDLGDLTDAERILMDDALRDFRLVRPGNKEVIEVPFRDSTRKLVTVHYVFADRPGLVVGRALVQPNGHFAVEI
jgi:hypothetical protein